MRRADRLFQIVQLLRRSTRPLTADAIADTLETSKRTIYRDVEALISSRVPIRGEAGVGYVIDRGFDLPPLMLTVDEAEAVALGCQWVAAHADEGLARAAADVRTKVAAMLPKHLRSLLDDPAVGTPPRDEVENERVDLARLRQWCRGGKRLSISYVDDHGKSTTRNVRPFLVGYVDRVRVVIAWCELRRGFRVFRTDRLSEVIFIDERYPDDPAELRKRWLASR
ncbi:MAG: YafY family protein [Archangium sp.]